MKKFLSLLVVAVLFNSCQQDIQTNTPAFEAKLNDVFWRASDATVSIDINGGMTITAYAPNETIIMTTSSSNPGTYILGTQNSNNFASYETDIQNFEDYYETSSDVEGPAFDLSGMLTGGSSYTSNPAAQTIGGSGVGLRVKTVANSSGAITGVTVLARGEGYVAGDIITIVGGNNLATFKVLNVQQSNGEIKITEAANGLYSGEFKFNAVNSDGEVVTFSKGTFYKIPLGL
jgi:hypothetical protein